MDYGAEVKYFAVCQTCDACEHLPLGLVSEEFATKHEGHDIVLKWEYLKSSVDYLKTVLK